MPDKRMPVDGPHPIYVERIPAGVRLDVSSFVSTLLVALACDFAEDPSGVADELQQLAESASSATMQTSHGYDDASSVHERDDRADRVLESLGGGALVVYGSQVGALARELLAAGSAQAVPSQREGGRAA